LFCCKFRQPLDINEIQFFLIKLLFFFAGTKSKSNLSRYNWSYIIFYNHSILLVLSYRLTLGQNSTKPDYSTFLEKLSSSLLVAWQRDHEAHIIFLHKYFKVSFLDISLSISFDDCMTLLCIVSMIMMNEIELFRVPYIRTTFHWKWVLQKVFSVYGNQLLSVNVIIRGRVTSLRNVRRSWVCPWYFFRMILLHIDGMMKTLLMYGNLGAFIWSY